MSIFVFVSDRFVRSSVKNRFLNPEFPLLFRRKGFFLQINLPPAPPCTALHANPATRLSNAAETLGKPENPERTLRDVFVSNCVMM